MQININANITITVTFTPNKSSKIILRLVSAAIQINININIPDVLAKALRTFCIVVFIAIKSLLHNVLQVAVMFLDCIQAPHSYQSCTYQICT